MSLLQSLAFLSGANEDRPPTHGRASMHSMAAASARAESGYEALVPLPRDRCGDCHDRIGNHRRADPTSCPRVAQNAVHH
jgi:hypothetical protein